MIYTPPADLTNKAVNVGPALNQWVNAMVPNGGTISLGGATYICDDTFELRRRKGITVEGEGALLVAQTPGIRTRANMRIIECGGVIVNDLNTQGAHPNGGMSDGAYVPEKEGQHGFDILRSGYVLLDRCSSEDAYGDFVYIGGWPQCQVVQIREFRGKRNGRQGISITSAVHVVVDQWDMSEMRRATFDLEPGGTRAFVDYVTIANGIGRNGRLLFVAAHGRNPVDHVTVHKNKLYGIVAGISVVDLAGGRRKAWTVTENESNKPAGNTGLAVQDYRNVDGVVVKKNRQPCETRAGAGGPKPRMNMVRTKGCTGEDVSGNTGVNMVGQLIPF